MSSLQRRFTLVFAATAFLWNLGSAPVGPAAACLFAAQPQAEAAKAPALREQWRAIHVGGTQIGYMHSTLHSKVQGGQKTVVNENVVVMAVALPRQYGAVVAPSNTRSKVTIQTEETESGDVLAFVSEVRNPPPVSTRKVGRIADGKLHIETASGGKVVTSEVPWQASLKGPAFADRSLIQKPLKPGETRTITAFDPRTTTADTIRFEAGNLENVLLQNGTEKRLLHVIVTHSVAPSVVMHEFLDEAGESWKTTIPSNDMVVHTVPRAVALKSFTDD